MKKLYIKPVVQQYETVSTQCLTVSIPFDPTGDGGPEGEVKESSDWDMWDDEE